MMDIDNGNITEQVTLIPKSERSIITVVGVGGAGGNAVNYMWGKGIRNVRFMICNTDQQALDQSPVDNVIRLGDNGLGAGNDPCEGRRAAMESIDLIRDRLEALNSKMLFITAGMGGGTGTGAAPVVARLAKEMGVLTVAIVTSPLLFEGQKRYRQAMEGIEQLKECVDSILVINNENIHKIYRDDISARDAFGKANEILCSAAKGVAEIITMRTGYINVDFADVSKVMSDSGRAHMSVASAAGKNRAKIAAKQSLTSPLLDNSNIAGAKNILLSIATSEENLLRFVEVTDILTYIYENARIMGNDTFETADIIWGMCVKPELGEELEIVLVATGFEVEGEDGAELDPQYSSRLQSTTISSGAFTTNRRVVLPEREARYPHIGTLLKTPAYIARKAELITEDAPHKKEETTHEGEDNSLFD